jgi:CheY-like chemotaxis protein
VDAALRKLRDSSFDLVLSDIVMPGGLSGLDLAHTLRDNHGELPLVLATGYSEKATQAQEEGFILLSKPYALRSLALAIVAARKQKSADEPHSAGGVASMS